MGLQILTQNDFWMDNALENFYVLLKAIGPPHLTIREETDGIFLDVEDEEAVLHSLRQQILGLRKEVIFQEIKDKKGLKRNIRLDYVLLPYGKQVAGRNVLVERFYDSKEMNRFLHAAITPRPGSRICVMCNRPFEKNVGGLKQGVYPLATKNPALSGVKRKSDYIEEVCPTCFVIGVLEWTDRGLPYRCSLEGHSIVLFPRFSSFRDLVRFKEMSRKILTERDLTSNIKTGVCKESDPYVGGSYSALLLFIEECMRSLRKEKTSRTVIERPFSRPICKDWICLKVPSGVVKNVKCSSIRIADSVVDIASSVTKLLQEGKREIVAEPGIYSGIIAKFNFRPEPRRPISWDRLQRLRFQLRESLARSFLENDLHSFSSTFLPQKGLYINISREVVKGVDILLTEWQLKPMNFSESTVGSIRKAADVMAEACVSNVGLLYQMDRAQTAPDFIFTLKEGAKKLVGIAEKVQEGTTRINPRSLEDFFQLLTAREEQWKLLRDALVLYTSIAYSYRKISGG